VAFRGQPALRLGRYASGLAHGPHLCPRATPADRGSSAHRWIRSALLTLRSTRSGFATPAQRLAEGWLLAISF